MNVIIVILLIIVSKVASSYAYNLRWSEESSFGLASTT